MKRRILFLGLLIQTITVNSQEVSTFFNDPIKKVDDDMALDYQGNLYGSHFMGSNVYKITPDGDATVFASGFNTPNGLAFDSQSNLYVCDLSGNRIYKISISGEFLDTIVVSSPSGIVKSFESDTMLFTQYSVNKLSKLAPDGTIILLESGSPMNGSVGLTNDDLGQLYVANYTDRKIYKYNSGIFTYVATVPGPASGALGFIAFAQGTLWGTSFNGNKIYKVYQNYVDSVMLYSGSTSGSEDGPIDIAQFSAPNGIIPSVTGDSLYISDFGTKRIRIISLNSTTGISKNEKTTKKISIYPNPSKDWIQISHEEAIDKIEIFNSSGNLVITSIDDRISIMKLPEGVYVVRVYEDDHFSSTRFIKM